MSDDADVAVPVLFVLALITALGVSDAFWPSADEKPTRSEVSALLADPED
ncbi:MAG: hypothetical protein AAF909_05215 [Pseudomonadota bacterium]